jgi:hypothetical protein
LVPPTDIKAISSAMKSMIERFPSYNSLMIRDQIHQRFSIENFGKNLSNIYRSLLKKQ